MSANSETKAQLAEESFMEDLKEAHIAAQKAVNGLYGPDKVKRGVWYRLRLSRAQNALISLYVRDLNKNR